MSASDKVERISICESFQRFKTNFAAADENTKYDIIFWFIGMSSMAVAIIVQFSWCGLLFCVGLVMWRASSLPSGTGK